MQYGIFNVEKCVENCRKLSKSVEKCRILVMSTIDPLQASLYTFKVEICIDQLI